MKLTQLSVTRPIIALAISAVVLVFGVLSYTSLGLELNPELKLPIVTVQASYPGASAQTVEEQVTRRIEDAVAGLGNIKTMTSTSQTGFATVVVEFREGVNVDVAASDVQQKVTSVRKDLPSDVDEPSYSKLDFNDQPIIYLAVTGGPAAEQTGLYRVADDIVRPRVEASSGVGRVVVAGGQVPELQVEVDPDRLRAYGLTVGDVTNAVRAQFLSSTAGQVKSGSGDATRRTAIRVDSRGADPTALGAIPVTSPDGTATELRNVARIYLGGKEPEEILRVNGRPAAGLLVYKQSSANIAQTVDSLHPVLAEIDDGLPAGYHLETVIDQSTSVRTTVKGVQDELILAALITGVVLFFFLHSVRSTVIVLISIPASLLVALIAMKACGYSLNGMTLIGLTTSIGVLVDDSIVVLENIFSHLERKKDPQTAAIDGRSEIGLAAIAITLVDVAVWGPILFISGVTGAFLRNFSIVMVAATLASLLVSFTLTPLIASRWLSAGSAHARGPLARLAACWEPAYIAFERLYARVLSWSLHHRPLVMLMSLLIFSSNFFVARQLGSEFVPDINRETTAVVGELPPGTALEAADRAARRWEIALLDQERFPEIITAYVDVGRAEGDRDPRFITVSLDLGATHSRHRTSAELANLAARAGEEMVPGMKARRGGDRAGGAGQPVQIRIFGDNLDQLTAAATTAHLRLGAIPELVDVANSMSAAPELTLRPDPQKLMDLGLNTQVVGASIRTAYQGTVAGRWAESSGKERDVRVRLPDSLRYDQAKVMELPIIRRGGWMLNATQVATPVLEDKPTKITRVNRQRVVTLGAEPHDVPLGTATQAATRVLDGLDLPAGMRWSFAGQGEEQASSFRSLTIGLGLSVLMMYVLLVVLYESWLQPVLILTALPLATVGAFMGLWGFGLTLSVPSMIGMVALFGLVGKNAILLVDRANHLRREAGLKRETALLQAGPSRLRPILMTSAVLILSMLPVALKLGDGGEQRAPLGAVLVGGMATSTVLCLLYVPVAYTYFDSLGTAVSRLFAWRPAQRVAAPAAAPHPSSVPLPIAGGAPLPRERAAAIRNIGRIRRQETRAHKTHQVNTGGSAPVATILPDGAPAVRWSQRG
ncbi:MAG: efflux RND transporter permease subunit [Chloroflexota bacterium]